MPNTTTAEFLAQLSEEELSSMFADADSALDPSPIEVRVMVMQERIRRHALACQDLECGFNPLD
jgi:hypothetical protein